ncbi:DUF2586 family protein, partial [Xanthovirga aplysinae]|uniref:DUF2586 family protein n=1 Tax=Xanthovirga aplysinae TaxID=2529853 RepID=UPI0012BB8AEF
MSLAKITFAKGSGGLGKAAPGEDYISGLLFYGTSPFGNEEVKQFFSLEEAEAAGIDPEAVETEVLHYHISEYFRINPAGSLYVGVFAGNVDAEKLVDLQQEADGKLRQVGVYLADATFAAEDSETIDALATSFNAVCKTLEDEYYTPLSVLLAPNIHGLDLGTLPDLSESSDNKVSVVIGQDGAGKGAALYGTKQKSITCLGAALGTVSKAAVHENIGWVNKFDVSGAELNSIAFANGEDVKTKKNTELDGIDDKNYIFLQKHVGVSGSYFNGSWTASSGDYENIELNRVIDKAIRGIREMMLPNLN